MADGPPGRDGPRRRDPRRAAPLARLRRLRAARGRPASRRCPRAASRCADLDVATERWSGSDPRVPPARAGHLRRERRLPAPRPHPLPRDLGGRVRRRGRPRPLPRAPATRGSRSSCTTRTVSPRSRHGAVPRGAAGARAGVAVRGVAEELACRPAATRASGSPPACGAPTGSRSATGAARRTPRRSTRPAGGSSCRWRSSGRSGPPRTTSSSARLVDSPHAGGRPVRRRSARTWRCGRRSERRGYRFAGGDGGAACWSIWRVSRPARRRSPCRCRTPTPPPGQGRGVRQGLAGRRSS